MRATLEVINSMRAVAEKVEKGPGRDPLRRAAYMRQLCEDATAEVADAVGALAFSDAAFAALRYNSMLLRIECTAPSQINYQQAITHARFQIQQATTGRPRRPAPGEMAAVQAATPAPASRVPWAFPDFGAQSITGGGA